MAKYLLLYMSSVSAEEQMAGATPEEIQKGMEPWMAWFGKHGAAITDGGNPLAHGNVFTKTGSSDSTSHVAGYSFIEAANADEAAKVVADHSHFMMDGNTIEMLEVIPMG